MQRYKGPDRKFIEEERPDAIGTIYRHVLIQHLTFQPPAPPRPEILKKA